MVPLFDTCQDYIQPLLNTYFLFTQYISRSFFNLYSTQTNVTFNQHVSRLFATLTHYKPRLYSTHINIFNTYQYIFQFYSTYTKITFNLYPLHVSPLHNTHQNCFQALPVTKRRITSHLSAQEHTSDKAFAGAVRISTVSFMTFVVVSLPLYHASDETLIRTRLTASSTFRKR